MKEIPLFYPYVPQEAIDEVNDTLKTRWIGQGEKVDKFEEEFGRKFNQNYCLTMNSGSAALETAYELVGIEPGDEVITTPLTCTATNIPLLRMGAKLIWADIDPNTLCLDAFDATLKITNKTKAIVNVHLGGIDNDLGWQPVPVISDACQALGVFNGDITCNSFQAIKHITTGDGGMLVVRDRDLYNKAKLMRWFGIDREKKQAANWQCYKERQMTFDIELLGYKRQMTDIAAALGLGGLKKYDYVLEYRRKLFNHYKTRLEGVPGIKVVDGDNNTCWLITVLVDRRDDFARVMFENGVDTNLGQVRNDVYKIFGGVRADLPVMNEVEGKYICLPLNMNVTIDDVEYICDLITKKGW